MREVIPKIAGEIADRPSWRDWVDATPDLVVLTRGEGPAGPAIAITGNSGLEAMG